MNEEKNYPVPDESIITPGEKEKETKGEAEEDETPGKNEEAEDEEDAEESSDDGGSEAEERNEETDGDSWTGKHDLGSSPPAMDTV